MDGCTRKLSEMRLKYLINEYVRFHLRVKRYRIVSVEDFGNHWRVKVVYNSNDDEKPQSNHFFAINYHGSLIWQRAC